MKKLTKSTIFKEFRFKHVLRAWIKGEVIIIPNPGKKI